MPAPPSKPQPPANAGEVSSLGDRLQKVLAAAGLGSRRECEQLITSGRVEIDRRIVTELGTRVHSDDQEIRVDGEVLRRTRRVYYMVNKPKEVLCTNFDPQRRTRVIDLVPADYRLFTVGRLDRDSEGLILVTNDGELANRLAHPRYEVEKTYLVQVVGEPTPDQLSTLLRGVHLAEGKAKAERIIVRRKHKQSTLLEIVLNEGKNREIRRILARIGHKVVGLKRIAVGPLRLGDLPTGSYRPLSSQEVAVLRSGAQSGRRERSQLRLKHRRPERAAAAERPQRGGPTGERPAPRTGSTEDRPAPRTGSRGDRPGPRVGSTGARPAPRTGAKGNRPRTGKPGPKPPVRAKRPPIARRRRGQS